MGLIPLIMIALTTIGIYGYWQQYHDGSLIFNMILLVFIGYFLS